MRKTLSTDFVFSVKLRSRSTNCSRGCNSSNIVMLIVKFPVQNLSCTVYCIVYLPMFRKEISVVDAFECGIKGGSIISVGWVPWVSAQFGPGLIIISKVCPPVFLLIMAYVRSENR